MMQVTALKAIHMLFAISVTAAKDLEELKALADLLRKDKGRAEGHGHLALLWHVAHAAGADWESDIGPTLLHIAIMKTKPHPAAKVQPCLINIA